MVKILEKENETIAIDTDNDIVYRPSESEVQETYLVEEEKYTPVHLLRDTLSLSAPSKGYTHDVYKVHLYRTKNGRYFLLKEKIEEPWEWVNMIGRIPSEKITPLTEQEAKDWYLDHFESTERYEEIFDVEVEGA